MKWLFFVGIIAGFVFGELYIPWVSNFIDKKFNKSKKNKSR
jgi:hypothetical protein